MVDISLNELQSVILNLIAILASINKHAELLEILKKSKSLLEKIIRAFLSENHQNVTGYSRENSYRSDGCNIF